MLLLNDLRYAEQSEAKKFYDMSGEKYINCVTGNTLFQSNTSMSSKWKFTFKNRLKKSGLDLFSCYQKCKL